MDTSALAAMTADLISDRLLEMLMEDEELFEGQALGTAYDTTLARRVGDGLVVELVELNDGALARDDGRRVLRISVEAIG